MNLIQTVALLSTNLLRRACLLGIVSAVALLTTNSEALAEPSKVTLVYSMEAIDGGSYFQKISGTLGGLGDVDFVFHCCTPAESTDPNVTVSVASPLLVTLLFTADSPGGNIIDGPVELADTEFLRFFVIESAVVVTTDLDTRLSRRATGTLSGSTITWDNMVPYEEAVLGSANCVGDFCGFVGPWPRDLDGFNDVPLPTFTVLTNSTFGDAFVSDNGTSGDPSDDINRPDPDATVKDTWDAVLLPEPSGEILLLAGVLGLAGLGRLRERGGARALVASLLANRH